MESPKKQQFLVLGTPQAIQNFVEVVGANVCSQEQAFIDSLYWDKKDVNSMIDVQIKLNDKIIKNNFVIPDEFKSTITRLQRDLEEFSSSEYMKIIDYL